MLFSIYVDLRLFHYVNVNLACSNFKVCKWKPIAYHYMKAIVYMHSHDVEPAVLTFVDDHLIATSKFQLFYWHGWK